MVRCGAGEGKLTFFNDFGGRLFHSVDELHQVILDAALRVTLRIVAHVINIVAHVINIAAHVINIAAHVINIVAHATIRLRTIFHSLVLTWTKFCPFQIQSEKPHFSHTAPSLPPSLSHHWGKGHSESTCHTSTLSAKPRWPRAPTSGRGVGEMPPHLPPAWGCHPQPHLQP